MSNNSNTNILTEFRVFFNAGEYDKAKEVLISQKHLFDPGVYEYNLGIVNYKTGNLVSARVNFEKAQIKGFYSKEVKEALKEVKSELGVISLEEVSSPLNSFKSFSYQVPVEIYLSITLLFAILFTIFRKSVTSKILRVFIFIIILLPTIFFYKEVQMKKVEVAKEEHFVFAGPSKMFEQVQLIPAGMKIITGKEVPGWKYIEIPESHSGWIEDTQLERL